MTLVEQKNNNFQCFNLGQIFSLQVAGSRTEAERKISRARKNEWYWKPCIHCTKTIIESPAQYDTAREDLHVYRSRRSRHLYDSRRPQVYDLNKYFTLPEEKMR